MLTAIKALYHFIEPTGKEQQLTSDPQRATYQEVLGRERHMMDYTTLLFLLTVWGVRYSTALSLNCDPQFCPGGVWDPFQCKCVEGGCHLTPSSCRSPQTYLNEVACKCQCPPTQCPSNQILNKHTCMCECRTCPSPKIPDPTTCACRCEDNMPYCPLPKVFNSHTCNCECPNRCKHPKIQDHSTCACICGINLCPYGFHLDRDLCKCKSDCPVVLCPLGILNPVTCQCG